MQGAVVAGDDPGYAEEAAVAIEHVIDDGVDDRSGHEHRPEGEREPDRAAEEIERQAAGEAGHRDLGALGLLGGQERRGESPTDQERDDVVHRLGRPGIVQEELEQVGALLGR